MAKIKPRNLTLADTLELEKRPVEKPRMRAPDLPGENGSVAALLRQAAAAHRLAEERLLADFGVTPPQMTALTLIGAHPGLLGADLARKAKLTPQTVSLILTNLRRAGLVCEEAGEGASRARPLTLTVAGENTLRRGRERTDAAAAGLIEGLRPKRERSLRRWLAAIAAGLPQPGLAAEAGQES